MAPPVAVSPAVQESPIYTLKKNLESNGTQLDISENYDGEGDDGEQTREPQSIQLEERWVKPFYSLSLHVSFHPRVLKKDSRRRQHRRRHGASGRWRKYSNHRSWAVQLYSMTRDS